LHWFIPLQASPFGQGPSPTPLQGCVQNWPLAGKLKQSPDWHCALAVHGEANGRVPAPASTGVPLLDPLPEPLLDPLLDAVPELLPELLVVPLEEPPEDPLDDPPLDPEEDPDEELCDPPLELDPLLDPE
jgi:hypothetical protein